MDTMLAGVIPDLATPTIPCVSGGIIEASLAASFARSVSVRNFVEDSIAVNAL